MLIYDLIKTLPCNTQLCRNAKELKNFIIDRKVSSILELGSWVGDSAILMAQNLPEDGYIICVDHFIGSPEMRIFTGIELYHQFLSNVKQAGTQVHQKIIPLMMSSKQAGNLIDAKFDMLYIDAAHDEENAYQDISSWYPFCKSGGIVCGDDTIHPIHGEAVLRAITRFGQENNLTVHATPDFWWYEKP